MKRKILSINEELCNGCGECVTGCAEGAIQLVDGKARLVKEQFCDGFGDCIGTCPTGALKIEERESDEFDVEATKRHLMQTQGPEAVARMEEANKAHEQGKHPERPEAHRAMPPAGGCPGSRMMGSLKETPATEPAVATGMPAQVNQPELDQWPVQIHLVSPDAPYFKNRELVVLSTCSPIASADIHWRFMRGRSVVVGCPKLDRTEGYSEKLGAILSDPSIPKVIIVRMEVPCCGGLTSIVNDAARISGRSDLEVEEVTVRLNGDIV